jgi:nucleoside-diphosphate-sugar epimerase
MKYYNYRSVLTKFIEKILNNEQITLYNNGISKRQYVFIDNIVFANYLALTNMNDNIKGETFNISVEDNPISLIDLVNMLYSKLNKEPNYILSDTKQMGDFDLNWEDISKAKEMLGYKVLVNMEDGITSHIKYKLGQ